MNKDLLPIGTVVLLKNASSKIVIAGFKIKPELNSDKVYDYIGYPYPQGFFDRDINFLFNNDQIDKIFYMGYVESAKK